MEEKETSRPNVHIPGVRYLFTAFGFFGIFAGYALRVNINVAIVAMVNTSIYIENNSSESECKSPYSSNSSNDSPSKNGEFSWSPEVQAAILGSFYYGYLVSQIPGGRLAEVYNGKWVFGIGTFVPAMLHLLFPLAARYSTESLIVIRAIEGLFQGVTFPAMHSLIGHWLPESEKGLLSTIIYSGLAVGTVGTMFLSGVLCSSDFLGGWPSTFYVPGVIGCIWFMMWCLLITETPLTHPLITKKELDYITGDRILKSNPNLPPIPWRKIMTSLPFWALIVIQTGGDWSFYTVLTDLPTYFSTILHFDVKDNGYLSSYPRLLQTALGLTVGVVSDAVLRRKLVSKIFVRKFCTVVSFVGPALAYIGVCLAGCNVSLNIVFFTLALTLGGFYYSGYNLTHLDLSPEYAGTLMGITNTISTIPGFLAPLFIGAITQNHQGLHEWRIIFGVVSVIMLLSTLFFVLFASADKQDWITSEDKEKLIDSGDNIHSSSSPPPLIKNFT